MEDLERIKKETTIFSLVSYLGHGLLMLRGLILASVLGPATYGFWVFYKDLFDLSSSTGLGASQAMSREIPENKAKGTHETVTELVQTTLGWNLLVGLLVVLGLTLTSLFAPLTRGLSETFLVCAIFFVSILHNFQRFRFKGEQRLIFFSRYNAIFLITNTLLTISLVFFFSLTGALIGLLLSLLISLAYLKKNGELFRPNLPRFRQGMARSKAGFAQLINGYVCFLCSTSDRFIILSFFGSAVVGLYGLAAFLVAIVSAIPVAISHVLYARTIQTIHTNNTRDSITHFFHAPLRFASALISAMVGFIYLNIDWAVRWLLPDYAEAGAVLQILAFGAFFSALWLITSNISVALKKDIRQLHLSLLMLTATIAGDICVILLGGGIREIALLSVSVACVASTSLMLYTQWLFTRSITHALIFVSGIVSPLIYAGCALWTTSQLAFGDSETQRVLLSNAIWLVACIPLLITMIKAGRGARHNTTEARTE